jgi:AmmeMemoRadiSam system protein A
MSPLADSEKKALLHLARRSFVAAVNRTSGSLVLKDLPDDAARSIVRFGGAFVTLVRKGRLRGCIGQLPSGAKLVDVIAQCAYAVASEDPRFPRVQPEELPLIEIELSVLSELFDIERDEIQPGKHGLFVIKDSQRGVLLPQVALQFHWDGTRFLEATCEKAGLARDAWKSDSTRVQAFTAEVFSEAESPTA